MNIRELLASTQEAVVLPTEPEKKKEDDVIQVGKLMRHKKRGTTVAIIKKDIAASSTGAHVHLVVESRTGKQFKALEANLEVAES